MTSGREPRSGRILLKALLILFGGVALLIGTAVVRHSLAERAKARELPAVRASAIAFLGDLAEGKTAEARSSASPEFQSKIDEAGLKGLVGRHPRLFSPKGRIEGSHGITDGIEEGGRAHASFHPEVQVAYEGLSLFLVRMDGRWVVDGLLVLDEDYKHESVNVLRKKPRT